ncbi:MAG: L-rhamnose isomerase [Mahellales bacterium]|jgi:L-rhamnose isomerase
MDKDIVLRRYQEARAIYGQYGVDTDKVLDDLQKVEISLHCWQGDDVGGFEVDEQGLSGGIMATGNYPGKARNAQELRADYEKAFSLIPGKQRANIHAIYLETDGKFVDRDQIDIKYFRNWIEWAKKNDIAIDFNTSMFSHPKAESGYTIASYDEGIRKFWIEHAKRSREIAAEIGKELGKTCVLNHWMVDGSKDAPVDRFERRRLFMESMDEIIAEKYPKEYLLDSVESKLFGLGMESFTVGSAEMILGYALTRGVMVTYDLGHFHPTESVADKISSTLLYTDKILLHTSRGVRWDSDHVVIQNDEVFSLMQEVVRAGALDRVFIALDFFDASINRIAAWVIGTRSTQKALLSAMLEPKAILLEKERQGDTTSRLALVEEFKNLPWTDVWNYFCHINNVPVGDQWLDEVKKYEKEVLAKRI